MKKQQWDDERKEEFHMKVSTSDIPLQYRKDGACFFYVEGSDHAGNISKTSYTCYVDDQRPTIAFFRLQGQTHKPVAKTQLELFYEEPLSVYVQALDGEASSGIAFIQWYTIDAMGVKSDIHKDVTDDHGGLSIPLDDGFSRLAVCDDARLLSSFFQSKQSPGSMCIAKELSYVISLTHIFLISCPIPLIKI